MCVILIKRDSPASQIKKIDIDTNNLVGVAIKHVGTLSDGAILCHTGFIVRYVNDDDTKFYLLHFGKDRKLLFEELDDHLKNEYGFLWLDFISKSSIDYFIADLNRIYSKNKTTIPYSIEYKSDENYFDENAVKLIDAGFTCATFVIHLLKRRGFNIFDIDNWPSDPFWQEKIALPHLIKPSPPNTQDFVAAQIAAIGIAPRFTPQQVVSGCFYFRKEPLKFQFVDSVARNEIKKAMNDINIIQFDFE